MKFSNIIFAVFIFATSSLVTVAQAGFITNLNEHDGTGLAISSPSSNWSRGWVFDVNIEDAWITQLGYYTPESITLNYTISLWDYSDMSLLVSTSVSGNGNEWNWFDIEAYALFQNQSYVLTLYSPEPSAYYEGSDDSLQPVGDIEYVQGQNCDNCSVDTFPTSTDQDVNYGLVDFAYQIGQPVSGAPVSAGVQVPAGVNIVNAPVVASVPVPEPSTLAIFSLGLLGLASRRMKKSA